MKTAPKPRVGIFGLTSCAGDQLMILNCEDELVALAGRIELLSFGHGFFRFLSRKVGSRHRGGLCLYAA